MPALTPAQILDPTLFREALSRLEQENPQRNPGSLHCQSCERCLSCLFCERCSSCYRCSYCERCGGCATSTHCAGCESCHDCAYCSDCRACIGGAFLTRCTGCTACTYCFGCVGLVKQEFCILNQTFSREEYFAIIRQLRSRLEIAPLP